jgi:hypothetical protein
MIDIIHKKYGVPEPMDKVVFGVIVFFVLLIIQYLFSFIFKKSTAKNP